MGYLIRFYFCGGQAFIHFSFLCLYFVLLIFCYQALVDTNDLEIFNHLTCCYEEKYKKEKGAVGSPLVSERVKIILAEVQDLSLTTRLQCLQHIGIHYISCIIVI